jgi:chromosomal replication initiator protein
MKAWEEFLLLQEKELGAETVKKWLCSLKVLRFDAGNLYLEAKDSFQAIWFEEHIRPKLLGSFVNNNHKKIRVHLSIGNKTTQTNPTQKDIKPAPRPTFHLIFNQLDPLCTLENFVPLEENLVTFKVLSESLYAYSPVYVYGLSGSGKTHLLMAIAKEQVRLGKKVIFTRAETFTDHVVAAIRSGEMVKFRQEYRNTDLLIVDDVHLFSRKGATQEEFFHTFNALQLMGKQILLSSKCAPQELHEIEPRLVSRFEWGIVLSLTAAKEKGIEPLLKKKAAALNYPLPPRVAEFLIESFTSGPKAVMRALEALILRSHIQQHGPNQTQPIFRPMTVQLAKHYLSDLLLAEKQNALTAEKIIQATSDHYGIRPDDILSKAQTRDCAHPRQISMFLCRHHLKLPFTKIGEIFGRDHSTVMSSVRLVKKSHEARDEEFTSAITEIEKKIGR